MANKLKDVSLERFFTKKHKFNIESPPSILNVNESSSKRDKGGTNLCEDKTVEDPALRKPINDVSINIRDQLRREYLAQGPFQPKGQIFPQKEISRCMRKFVEDWYDRFGWLEYSVSKDAAFCLWCYLFPTGHKNGDDVFTRNGFSNWKNAFQKSRDHGGNDSRHNHARVQVESFRDQRHNLEYILSQQGSENERNYRICLTAIVDVIRLLLKLGLPFRGNDESLDSMNRGNFLEFFQWYYEHNEEVNKVVNLKAPGNYQLTSPKIQKEIVCACAMEVRNIIVNEIGGKFFFLLIDEARDSSIKEQMAVVLRFVNDNGEVIERFLGMVHVSDTCACL